MRMKPKFLLLPCVALAFLSVAAQPSTKPPVPTYLVPGAELQLNTLKSITSRSCIQPGHKVSPAKHVRNQNAYARISGTILDATPRASATKDTVLVTSYDYIRSYGEAENKATVEYDKYGMRTMLKESSGSNTRYTYTYDDDCRWVSRVVETNQYGNWKVQSKQERTIANGLVNSVTFYEIDGSVYDDAPQLIYKRRYCELEYRSGITGGLGDIGNVANAAVTKDLYYDENGEVTSETHRAWFEPAGEYLETYYLSTDYYGKSKRVAAFEGDHVVTSEYTYKDNEFIKEQDRISYYGSKNGEIYIYYNDDGSISEPKCYVNEGFHTVECDSVLIHYTYTNGKLAPESKIVLSADALAELDYSRDFRRSDTRYSYENGDWVQYYYYCHSHHLLSNGLSEITLESNSSKQTQTVKMERTVDADGYARWVESVVKMNDDGSYVATREEDNSRGYVYSYYAADGTLQKTIRQTYSEDVNNELVFMVQLAGETEWKYLEEFTNVESDGSQSIRTVYKTNPNGTPHSITEYATSPRYNGGNEFKNCETIYTYKDNGDYEAKTHAVMSPSTIGSMKLSESVEKVTLADGSRQFTELEYDENGNETIYSGNREVYQTDGLIKYYTYKRKTAEWQFDHAYCGDLQYTTDDGVEVSILRRVSDDQMSVVNEHMSEHKEVRNDEGNATYEMSASYDWDADKGKWIGENKYEHIYMYYTFEIYDPDEFNPINTYDDEYMLVVPDENYRNWEHVEAFSVSYRWDEPTDSWKAEANAQTCKAEVNGNTLTYTKTETEDNDWEFKTKTETTVTERDEMWRVVKIEHKNEEHKQPKEDGREPEDEFTHYITSYTYNPDCGMLAETKEEGYDKNGILEDSSIYRYTYSNFTIEVSGITDVAADATDVITVDGLGIHAAGQNITVYDVNGRVLITGTGSVELPAAIGVYIVKAGTAVRKIAVK